MSNIGSFQNNGEQQMVSVGQIAVTNYRVITPSGQAPLAQTTWAVQDMSRTTKSIPTWAIVCAIIFFIFCLLGLLFLLVKEETTEGIVQIQVQGPGLLYVEQIPVSSVQQVYDINARINYARSLSASMG
jgi:hypothetical protein